MSNHQESSSTAYWIIGVIIAITFLIIGFLAFRGSTPGISSKTNRQVALTCTTHMATQFHIHPVLKIVINGQNQELPAHIGIRPNCMNSIHTHDNSGTLHVEAPEKRDFTLSDFFAVWNKTFTRDQILDYKVDDTHIIKVTVNGTTVETYEKTVLVDKDQIVISYETK